MADKFMELAKKERDRLRAELQKSNIYLRLKWLEDFIAANDKSRTSAEPVTASSNGAIYKTKRDKIEGYARECIKLKDNKATMRDIHQHLENRGVRINQKTLSAYLSLGKERMNTTYNEQTKEWSVS